MVPVLVLTHGNLADELVKAARSIDPHLEAASVALSLPWEVDFDQATRQLKQQLRSLEQGAGVLILTDMFGGTATNLALPFLEPERVEVVTGVNLPMLVKLGSLRDQGLTLHEVAVRLAEAGQKSIRMASEFLRQRSNA
jgi:mannose PTS system EIIA component